MDDTRHWHFDDDYDNDDDDDSLVEYNVYEEHSKRQRRELGISQSLIASINLSPSYRENRGVPRGAYLWLAV